MARSFQILPTGPDITPDNTVTEDDQQARYQKGNAIGQDSQVLL